MNPIQILSVTSPAFVDGGPLPQKYTADGADVAPPLSWSEVPPDTKSVAILCEDPDAPKKNFAHWVLYDITPSINELPGQAMHDQVPQNAKVGTNDFGRLGYAGPCPPPSSEPHRYEFKVFALDKTLELDRAATRDQVCSAMESHILAEGQIVGRYGRSRATH